MATASRDIELSHIPVEETDYAGNDKDTGAGGGKTQLVFRFLKLTFENRRLEELYKRSVYRQYQFLLLIVCALVVFLALLGLIITASTGKVRVWSCLICSLPYRLLPQLSVLPVPEQELSECVSIANLTFAWVSGFPSSSCELTSSSLPYPAEYTQCGTLWCSLAHSHMDSDRHTVCHSSCCDLC